jgi:hypothetical protein
MSCPRCLADPQPSYYRSSRRCAFDDRGNFKPDNWDCATLTELNRLDSGHPRIDDATADGQDESLACVYCGGDGFNYGWIVLTQYKRRRQCSSAVYVGDWFPPATVTLALVERTLEFLRRARLSPAIAIR